MGRQHGDVGRRPVAAEQPAHAARRASATPARRRWPTWRRRVGDVGRASTPRDRKEAFVDGVEDFVDDGGEVRHRLGPRDGLPGLLPRAAGRQDRPRDRDRAARLARSSGRGGQRSAARCRSRSRRTTCGCSAAPGRPRRVGARRAVRVPHARRRGHAASAWSASATRLATAFAQALVVRRQGAAVAEHARWTDLVVEAIGSSASGSPVTGSRSTVRATRGVMLAAGGFESNLDWRQKYHRASTAAPSGNPGNLGGPSTSLRRRGAALELMDDAWWGASDRSRPGRRPGVHRRRAVDALLDHGRRRAASASPTSRSRTSTSATTCSTMTAGRARTGSSSTPGTPAATCAPSRPDPPRSQGHEESRHRGDGDDARPSSHARWASTRHAARDRRPVQRLRPFRRRWRLRPRQLGLRPLLRRPDGAPQPEPRPHREGPVHRLQVVFGDLGTKGGVVTDADARALREDGSVIEGLYAAGNNSASVMGHTYPGPGSTIGPAVGLRPARRAPHGKGDGRAASVSSGPGQREQHE